MFFYSFFFVLLFCSIQFASHFAGCAVNIMSRVKGLLLVIGRSHLVSYACLCVCGVCTKKFTANIYRFFFGLLFIYFVYLHACLWVFV